MKLCHKTHPLARSGWKFHGAKLVPEGTSSMQIVIYAVPEML